ncbi:MAG: hypothetical protein ABI687_07935 [Flavitalea sp.]
MAKMQDKEYAEMSNTVNALAPAVIRILLADALPDQHPQNRVTTDFTFDLFGAGQLLIKFSCRA